MWVRVEIRGGVRWALLTSVLRVVEKSLSEAPEVTKMYTGTVLGLRQG